MQKINILNSIAETKTTGFKFSKKINKDVIAGLIDDDRTIGYVLKGGNDKNEEITQRSNKSFCPYLSLNSERNVVVITGDSGDGKTLLASILLDEHKKHFPEDKIYFISGNNISDDENLSEMSFIEQIDIDELETLKAEDFQSSMVLIDDCDYNKKNKFIMDFLNDLVERGRKFFVSLIFISHINSRLNKSVIYRDFNIYITFQDNLLSNRLIENTLKIKQDMLLSLKNTYPSFVCFNKKYRCIITNKNILSY